MISTCTYNLGLLGSITVQYTEVGRLQLALTIEMLGVAFPKEKGKRKKDIRSGGPSQTFIATLKPMMVFQHVRPFNQQGINRGKSEITGHEPVTSSEPRSRSRPEGVLVWCTV